jgi:cytoskeletal protein CcmA (bactofilin family)
MLMAEKDSTVKQTIVEEGTEFEGTLKSTCPISVSGKLQGMISAPSMTILQSGAVHGKIKVQQLKSQGEISGEIDADSVELSGRVSDQTTIRAKTLEVSLNQKSGDEKLQMTFGNCELQVGERSPKLATDPVKTAAVDHGHKENGKPEPALAGVGQKVEVKK